LSCGRRNGNLSNRATRPVELQAGTGVAVTGGTGVTWTSRATHHTLVAKQRRHIVWSRGGVPGFYHRHNASTCNAVSYRFPQISELPPFLRTDGWSWEKFDSPTGLGSDFWVGTDREGNRWLVKPKGSFDAFRERVFGALAQRIGLSCQSSVLVELSKGSPPLEGRSHHDPYNERVHVALWLLPEHSRCWLGKACPVVTLFDHLQKKEDRVAAFLGSTVEHAVDWIRGDMMLYLCMAHEPSGRLFTPDHQFVLIDNEKMFSSAAEHLEDCDWLYDRERNPSAAATEIALDLCDRLSSVGDEDIETFCAIPSGFVVRQIWRIKPRVYRARKAARAFLKIW
jgi:hypothetical protein